MTRTLVIVESAAKSKTIQNYLGSGYVVRACFGHVRDLPTDRIGVDVDRDFAADYVVPEARARVVKELKAEARSASAVLLASDPDREGEAIAWHLVAALGLKSGRSVRRIAFQEITRGAIQQAVQQPRAIDMHLVDAQQARRILDRLIGYPVSQVLGRTIQRGLSAGRVQSVAVRLVVDREREIEVFVPVEYWSLEAQLRKRAAEEEPPFLASLVARDGKKLALTTAEETEAAGARGRRELGGCISQSSPATAEPTSTVYDQHLAARGQPKAQLRTEAHHGHGPAAVRRCADRRGDRRPHHLHAHGLGQRGGDGSTGGTRVHPRTHRPAIRAADSADL